MRPVTLLFAATCATTFGFAQSPANKLDDPQLEARVEAVLKQMTLVEKIALLHGDSKFTTAAIPRLGIPRRWMSDGPHGVREDVGPDTWDPSGHTDDFSSFMPVNICLAASWDPEIARASAGVIGQEAKWRGKHIMLGPGLNIMRTPLNGRNFEYFGEDPFLTSRMAVGYVQGEQAQGVSSCVKHYAGNNQETARGSVDVEMDDRTLYEIFLPAFKAAVQEGGAMSVMSAYNRFRGQYCSENELLLNKILKGEWGFKGIVMSDWGGVHSTLGAAMNGLDVEMGSRGPYDTWFLARPLEDLVTKGSVPMSVIDDKARRNLRVILATLPEASPAGSLNTPQHQAIARKAAEEGIVLLKNQGGLLPLDPARVRTIAVIGDNAIAKLAHGGGSAGIKAFYEITPLDGILNRAGNQVNVTFSQGYKPVLQRPGRADAAGVKAAEAKAEDRKVLLDRAVQAAKQADVVVFVGGLYHGWGGDDEGSDRRDLKLPFGQDELIKRIEAANRNTVVVLMSGAPVEMNDWLPKTNALIQAWFPGMEGGNALAEILFGDVNPSGKLPCTFPKKLEDSPAHALHAYPGVNGVETYSEGLLVGYRWFDTKNIEPLFPFGFGLSYTTFGYSNARLVDTVAGTSHLAVQVDVENTGRRDGEEVVQLYIQPVALPVMRPLKELKAFRKVALKAGERKTVEMTLDPLAFSYFDPQSHTWVQAPGAYRVLIGSSSRDIRAQLTYNAK